MKDVIFYPFICSFVLFYVILSYFLFQAPRTADEFPMLRSRLGNIMWHSDDYQGVFQGNLTGNYHLYCYYPNSQAQYSNKSGEYIIKRADNVSDCSNFYGMVTFEENPWVSEKEKIWWSKNQRDFDNLAAADPSQVIQ